MLPWHVILFLYAVHSTFVGVWICAAAKMRETPSRILVRRLEGKMLHDLHLSKRTIKAPLQVLLAALETIDGMVLGEVSPKAFPPTLINQLLPALYNIQLYFGILSTSRFYHLHMEKHDDSQHYLLPVMRAAVRGTGISFNQLIAYLRDKDGAEQVLSGIIKRQGEAFNLMETFSTLAAILKWRLQKQPKNIFASVSSDEDREPQSLDGGALLQTFIRKYSQSRDPQSTVDTEDDNTHEHKNKHEHEKEKEKEGIAGTKMRVLISGSNVSPIRYSTGIIFISLLLLAY